MTHNVKILFVGIGKHGQKVRSIAINYLEENNLNFKFIYICKTFREDILACDQYNSLEAACAAHSDIKAAFICSPDRTHLEYTKMCIFFRIPYIYVEKPAIGVEEFFSQQIWKDDFLPYIQVGYQWMYDKALQLIKSAVNTNQYGCLHKIDLFVGHGFAYKPEFLHSWRSKDSNVLKTLGCHPLNYLLNLNEDIKDSLLQYFRNTSLQNNPKLSTHSIAFVTANNTCVSATCSWRSPKENYIHLIFEDSIVYYDFKNLTIYTPRDTFDSNGYFIKPPEKIIQLPHSGIIDSVQLFLKKSCFSNQKYNSEFHNSSLTAYLVSS